MKTRRAARETAMQILYQCESQTDWREQCIETFLAAFDEEVLDNLAGPQTQKTFLDTLVLGVIKQIEVIDQTIQQASQNWSVERMARVDRNLLRVAVFEMMFVDDVSLKVSINEAIEIAKKYGAADSPTFVNGVLDKIATGLGEKNLKVA